jgi:hypothetical protein
MIFLYNKILHNFHSSYRSYPARKVKYTHIYIYFFFSGDTRLWLILFYGILCFINRGYHYSPHGNKYHEQHFLALFTTQKQTFKHYSLLLMPSIETIRAACILGVSVLWDRKNVMYCEQGLRGAHSKCHPFYHSGTR